MLKCGLITRHELINKLKQVNKEQIIIKISSYFEIELIFKHYDYKKTEDRLILKDLNSENYISFNFNNIRSMQINENTVTFYIDDVYDTKIEIII